MEKRGIREIREKKEGKAGEKWERIGKNKEKVGKYFFCIFLLCKSSPCVDRTKGYM